MNLEVKKIKLHSIINVLLFIVLLINFSVSNVYAEKQKSTFPWRTNETFKYKLIDKEGTYTETCKLLKIKEKKGKLLHLFKITQNICKENKGGTSEGTFIIDENGHFHKFWGCFWTKRGNFSLGFSIKHKKKHLLTDLRFRVGSNNMPSQTEKIENVSENTWVLGFASAYTLSIFLSKLRFEEGLSYDIEFLVSAFDSVTKGKLNIGKEEKFTLNDREYTVYDAKLVVPIKVFRDDVVQPNAKTTVELKVEKNTKKLIYADLKSEDMRAELLM